jgi:hypothetical protein
MGMTLMRWAQNGNFQTASKIKVCPFPNNVTLTPVILIKAQHQGDADNADGGLAGIQTSILRR